MCKVIVTNLIKRNVLTIFKGNRNIWSYYKCSLLPFTSFSRADHQFEKTCQQLNTMTELNGPFPHELFEGNTDRYQGVTVDSLTEPCDAAQFTNKLEASLKNWGENNVRGVWFRVALEHADWVPVLAKNGFTFHHSRSQHVMMYRWLPETEQCNIPPFAHTMIGVGAIVENSVGEILVVKERYFNVPHWKLPGGYVEPKEDIGDAAVREVLEETNVRTEFQFLVTLRHTHHGMFGCSDIYFIAGLTPLSDEITKCNREIADCKWMKVEEFLEHPHVHDGNRFFVKKYLEYQKSGNSIGCIKNYHAILKKPQCVYSIVGSGTPPAPPTKEQEEAEKVPS